MKSVQATGCEKMIAYESLEGPESLLLNSAELHT